MGHCAITRARINWIYTCTLRGARAPSGFRQYGDAKLQLGGKKGSLATPEGPPEAARRISLLLRHAPRRGAPGRRVDRPLPSSHRSIGLVPCRYSPVNPPARAHPSLPLPGMRRREKPCFAPCSGTCTCRLHPKSRRVQIGLEGFAHRIPCGCRYAKAWQSVMAWLWTPRLRGETFEMSPGSWYPMTAAAMFVRSRLSHSLGPRREGGSRTGLGQWLDGWWRRRGAYSSDAHHYTAPAGCMCGRKPQTRQRTTSIRSCSDLARGRPRQEARGLAVENGDVERRWTVAVERTRLR